MRNCSFVHRTSRPPLGLGRFFPSELPNQVDKQNRLSRSGCSIAVQGLWFSEILLCGVLASLYAHFEVSIGCRLLALQNEQWTTPAGLAEINTRLIACERRVDGT